MKKQFVLTFIYCLLSILSLSQGIHWEWAKRGGGYQYDEGSSIKSDRNGNVYITGNFKDTATFEDTILISHGGNDIFIAKYDNSGNMIWIKQVGGKADENVMSITTDSNYFYITGAFRDSVNFGDTLLISSAYSDVFVAKYEFNGNLVWARQAGGSSNDFGRSVSIDNNGNVFITGNFRYYISFGDTLLTSSGLDATFIAKYDSSGFLNWVKGYGLSYDWGRDVSTDNSNNIIFAISFWDSILFEDSVLYSQGANDIIIAKYSNNGTLLWFKQFGGIDEDNITEGHSIGIDNNNIYLTGYFKVSCTIGDTTIYSNGHNDIFIVKYDTYGNFIWAKQEGGSSSDVGQSICISKNNGIYITGSFCQTAIFSDTTIVVNPANQSFESDLFVAKYDFDGNFKWVTQAGGTDIDEGLEITSDHNNNIFLCGEFRSSITFGDTTLFTFGYADMFIAKLNEDSITKINAQNNVPIIKLYPNPAKNIINIEIEKSIFKNFQVEIFNVKGESLFKNQFENKLFQLDVSNYHKGIYLIEINDGNSKVVKKMIIN